MQTETSGVSGTRLPRRIEGSDVALTSVATALTPGGRGRMIRPGLAPRRTPGRRRRSAVRIRATRTEAHPARAGRTLRGRWRRRDSRGWGQLMEMVVNNTPGITSRALRVTVLSVVMDVPTRLPAFRRAPMWSARTTRRGYPRTGHSPESFREWSISRPGASTSRGRSVERRHPAIDPRLEDQDVPELVAQVPTSRPVEVPGLANRERIEHPLSTQPTLVQEVLGPGSELPP